MLSGIIFVTCSVLLFVKIASDILFGHVLFFNNRIDWFETSDALMFNDELVAYIALIMVMLSYFVAQTSIAFLGNIVSILITSYSICYCIIKQGKYKMEPLEKMRELATKIKANNRKIELVTSDEIVVVINGFKLVLKPTDSSLFNDGILEVSDNGVINDYMQSATTNLDDAFTINKLITNINESVFSVSNNQLISFIHINDAMLAIYNFEQITSNLQSSVMQLSRTNVKS